MVRHTLLEVPRTYWDDLEPAAKSRLRFHHVSTDEVYGSLPPDGLFTEETPYLPSSPNSASKASSDHLVRALHHTFGLPVLITNCSNNFGPNQFPEKLIPVIILNAVAGRPLPVYRTGDKLRDWLYVDDHATALHSVLTRGKVGDTYNIGVHYERTNLNVVRSICGLLDELCPNSPFRPHASLISLVIDRRGHYKRYAIDASKIQRELDWKPSETFESGLRITVDWYLNNRVWWERALSGAYRQMMDESENGGTEKRAV